ncbi:hypothetical protein SK854_32995 [Lentzea sp. BCCO 10_0061]|uniref:Transposase n=1 Tax=Lentzea sokolovensis TaxID=3095429 RepID=A0ABU4V7P6_9PSEU|nr:hypothetical protein [Lentzea sp. BCCO 10_0061]MDX8146973.1 hypothetical protein [Lentzea sp. BCCO 10_0061]
MAETPRAHRDQRFQPSPQLVGEDLLTHPTRPARTVAADVTVFLGVAALLWRVVHLARGANVPWDEASAPSTVSTDPAELPYCTERLLRMFAVSTLSVVFSRLPGRGALRPWAC